jgi:hypothetical protein
VPADTQHRRGNGRHSDEARPVTVARITLELLLAEVCDQVVDHEQRIAALAERITEAVRTAAIWTPPPLRSRWAIGRLAPRLMLPRPSGTPRCAEA